jgi:type II secretory pathway component PulF
LWYSSTYLDEAGREGTATLEARDEQDLHEILHRQGRLLLRATTGKSEVKVKSRRFPPKKLLIFTQSMESSLDAGVPVLQALESIKDQEDDPRYATVYDGLCERLTGGGSLAECLKAYPRSFSPIYASLVHAGESSGKLPSVFATLGSFLEWRSELVATARQAMIYPAIVMTAAYALVLFLLTFVIPSLGEVIGKLGADELPTASLWLISISGVVNENILTVIGASLAAVIALVFAMRTDRGRALLTGSLNRLPVARTVVSTLNIAQLCRTMSALLGSGITVIQAMELAEPALSLPSLRNGLRQSKEKILAGSKVHSALQEVRLLPPVALGMVRIGEESGDLPKCFDRLGRMYDREAKAAVKRALAMLEPAVVVALGVIIGSVAAVIISTLYTAVGGLGR